MSCNLVQMDDTARIHWDIHKFYNAALESIHNSTTFSCYEGKMAADMNI
jgi:hypothetical protein